MLRARADGLQSLREQRSAGAWTEHATILRGRFAVAGKGLRRGPAEHARPNCLSKSPGARGVAQSKQYALTLSVALAEVDSRGKTNALSPHSLRSTFRSARNCVRRRRVSAIAATEELLGVAVTNPVL